MSKIIFRVGEESVPVAPKTLEEYNDSPFKDCLEAAKREFEEIMDRSGSSLADIPHNNVVAFLGERGSGKTSCMTALKKGFTEDVYGWSKHEKKLEFLPMIDPSFFDNKHNILEIFIGEMFREYKKLKLDWIKLGENEREMLRRLKGRFTDVKRALRFLYNSDEDLALEEHEELLGLSEGVNLVGLMRDLISDFLKYRGKDVLVISIDDIDVNIKEAYVMMEQIRKYLLHHNVIILLGAKLQQLSQAISLYYHKEVLPMRYKDNDEEIIPDVISIAERYLDKFIPLSHRIFMPANETVVSTELDIIEADGSVFSRGTVEFTVLSLIYEKCGFLFYNYEDGPSLIIPDNLRELRLLTSLLMSMKDRSSGKTEHIRNKQVFKKYFYDEWLSDLPEGLQLVAKSISSERNYTQLNKIVVTKLSNLFRLRGNSEGLPSDDSAGISGSERVVRTRMAEICNPHAVPSNISLGDVLFIIDKINQRLNSIEVRRLLFFITTHYSILLYELYDEMTDSIRVPYEENKLPRLVHNRLSDIPDYFKVVGKNFFVLTGGEFVPSATSGYSREVVMINGRLLLKEIKTMMEDIKQSTLTIAPELWPVRWTLLEFFILTTTRRADTKDASFSIAKLDEWRTDSTSDSYFSKFNPGVKNILFEVTAPFLNMISLRRAYDRFHPDLYKTLEKCKGSLLYRLLQCRRNPDISKEHDFMSQMTIRNTEVLVDLQWWMEKMRDRLRPDNTSGESRSLEVLKQFYSHFEVNSKGNRSNYEVKTYDLQSIDNEANTSPEKKYHSITFQPLSLLGKCLDDVLKDSEALALFTSIYSPVVRIEYGREYSQDDLKDIFENAGIDHMWKEINGDSTLFPGLAFEQKERLSVEEVLHLLLRSPYASTISDKIFDPKVAHDYRRMLYDYHAQELDETEKKLADLNGEITRRDGLIKNAENEISRITKLISDLKKEKAQNSKEKNTLYKLIQSVKDQAKIDVMLHEDLNRLQHEEVQLTGQITDNEGTIRNINSGLIGIKNELAVLEGDKVTLQENRSRLISRLRMEERARVRYS